MAKGKQPRKAEEILADVQKIADDWNKINIGAAFEYDWLAANQRNYLNAMLEGELKPGLYFSEANPNVNRYRERTVSKKDFFLGVEGVHSNAEAIESSLGAKKATALFDLLSELQDRLEKLPRQAAPVGKQKEKPAPRTQRHSGAGRENTR